MEPRHLSVLRASAHRLLRDFRGSHPDRVAAAAARFLRLRSFEALTVDALLADRARVRLKHALAAVAIESGHASWRDAKRNTTAPSDDDPRLMYDPGFAALLNVWFADYDEARAALERNPGFLLPYASQFVVCESEAIRLLGLDPDDPDWERIGFDFVAPRDRDAWRRLRARRLAALRTAR